jgi:hypothetical protein
MLVYWLCARAIRQTIAASGRVRKRPDGTNRCAKVAEVGEDLGKLEALHRVMRRPSLTSRRMRAVTNEAESLREYRKPLRKPRSGAVAGRVLLFVTLLATKTPE